MKSVLQHLYGRLSRQPEKAPDAESSLFSSTLLDDGWSHLPMVPWSQRRQEIQARNDDNWEAYLPALQQAWARDRSMGPAMAALLPALATGLDWVQVPAGQTIIRQQERGDFMLIVASGSLTVDREQAWGQRLRLGETRPGDVLGEMSLLDGGTRFSGCTSLSPSVLAVLSTPAVDRLLLEQPAAGAALMAAIARKLSRQLRALSRRLGDQHG